MPKIKIDKELYEKVKAMAIETGYSSVDEFVIHVFEDVTNRPGSDDNDPDVLNRLKGMGYIS